MKILFVRTYCPNSIAYGSEMRAALYVNYFRQKGTVDLLTLTAPGLNTDTAYIQAQFNKYYYFDQRGKHLRLGKLEKLFYFVPWQITKHYAKDFQQRLNDIIEDNQYDLIFVLKLDPILYFLQLATCWRKRVVIDFDDILSDLYLNYYRSFLTARKNSYSLKFYEHKALQLFKRVFVCSPYAVSRISLKYLDKVGIIPNVFHANSGQFIPTPESGNRILFVGSLDYFPNMEGLKWFCAHIWPEFLKQYPDATLSIVGKMQKDSNDIHAFLGHPLNTEVFTNVPSVSPFYRNCTATVVPLLNASGTRLKILESVAYGRPVITTLKGMEGLDFEQGKNIFVFKDTATFINAYKILVNKTEYAKVTQNALGVLKEKYSPEVFRARMDENYSLMI